MGYMCRRHATVSCENVSRDPMGPAIFTSCLFPRAHGDTHHTTPAPCPPPNSPGPREPVWRSVLLRGPRENSREPFPGLHSADPSSFLSPGPRRAAGTIIQRCRVFASLLFGIARHRSVRNRPHAGKSSRRRYRHCRGPPSPDHVVLDSTVGACVVTRSVVRQERGPRR
jgi:hypothetical protein